MTRVALAQELDAGTRMAARDLAVAGAEAFEQADYATALDRFQRAEALYRVPSISLMTARCLARAGRVVEAVNKYEETMRAPMEAGAPEAFQRAVAEAAREIESTRSRVARIELKLPAEPADGLELTIDGKRVPDALHGVAIPLDPGVHRISARATGREPFTRSVRLGDGERQTLEVAFESKNTVGPAPVSPADGPNRRVGGGASLLGMGLLSVGGVGLAIGTVTGVVALNRQASLDAACTPGCPPELASDLDSFRLNRSLSYVAFGVGLAAAGAGAYLVLRKDSSGEMGALLFPHGAAVRGRF